MCLAEAFKLKASKSPLRRRQREPVKPRLSRKIVPSAKVNLNAYWSQFEELSKQIPSFTTYDLSRTANLSDSTVYSAHLDNEINDNLINELMELGNK